MLLAHHNSGFGSRLEVVPCRSLYLTHAASQAGGDSGNPEYYPSGGACYWDNGNSLSTSRCTAVAGSTSARRVCPCLASGSTPISAQHDVFERPGGQPPQNRVLGDRKSVV